MQFLVLLWPAELHARPCRNADRAHSQSQRHDDRLLPGQAAVCRRPNGRWARCLKTGGYDTFFTGKWHLGEADYALPNAQGYDVMKYAGLYHLNAYTYGDPTWFPDMSPDFRAMFNKRNQGRDVGQCRRDRARGFQDQRAICQYA